MLKILVEGRPGAGKTTVAAKLADLLRERRIDVCGFVTHEIRESGRRVGFEIEAINGQTQVLAHVELRGPPRVGKYGVDLEALERVALPALEKRPKSGVVLIDELGKMELASEAFRTAVSRVFGAAVNVVATVHVFRNPFTDALKRRSDVELVRVTHASRRNLPEQLADRLGSQGD